MDLKHKITDLILIVLMAGSLAGCAGKESNIVKEPDITQIRNICNLATVKCYYHNVAKSEKKAAHFLEKDKKFWIEYTGVANLGIDMSKVKMEIDGINIKVTIPKAQLLNISIDETSLNDDSFTTSQDGWNKNEITADDQTAAINQAQKEMEKSVQENSALLVSAQDRAQKLIENYINRLGEAVGVEYTIEWVYEEED